MGKKKSSEKKSPSKLVVIRLNKRGNIDPKEIRRAVKAVINERAEKERAEDGHS